MPGVAVQQPAGFGASHSSKWMSPLPPTLHRKSSTVPAAQNGSNRFRDDMSVADIKAKAKEAVNREARGVSVIALIKSARTQILSAKEHEARGDLRSAFGSYIRAATLAKMAMDSPEYEQESRGKGGVIRKEMNDFLAGDGRDITSRTSAVEDKLKAIERTQAVESTETRDIPTGKSIKDRMKALQDNGLSLGQPKSPALQTPPMSPRNFNSTPHFNPLPTPPSVAPSISASVSNHVFVSPSTLGPPSPTSSPSSSPPTTALSASDLNGFNQAFPSIDELDNTPAFSLPSVPTGVSSTSSSSHNKDLRNAEPPLSPLVSFRNFVPIERPSSTPITPTNINFGSRPPSPKPIKPSGLSNGVIAPSTPKIPLPVKNTAFPKDLQAYIRDYNVLLIDMRHRADFDREHIKANAVVCIEPYVLLREGVTAEALENAMVVGPRQEASIFGNRDKFDLVAVYDDSSKTFGAENTPLSILVRVIFEQAFKKMLKRTPMMLVGGIEAWKKDLGEADLVRGSSYMEIRRPIPTKDIQSPLLASSSSKSNNPFTNGLAHTNSTGNAHDIWTPPQRSAQYVNGTIPEHRPTMSLDQSGHSRSPADATYSGSHSGTADKSLTRRPAILRPSSSSISFSRSIGDTMPSPVIGTQSMVNGGPPSSTPITYPQFPRRISPHASGSGSGALPAQVPFSAPPTQYDIASPPQASINPSQLSRRRSDFVDQSQEALSGFNASRSPPGVDYPEITSPTIVRPPPVAASSLERQDKRVTQPFSPPPSAALVSAGPKPPRIQSDYPTNYWADIQIGISGLKNLGNTCYMNAPIQCLSATVPFARFFTEGRWKSAVNYTNPLGSKGKLTGAFATLLHQMWGGDLPYLTPIDFRRSICSLKSQYNGSDQHDSQEFLSFLMDGIHEDLNRILSKPNYMPTPEEEAELERLPPQIASDREWRNWRARNDSLVVDYFQGQFRNRLECLTCHKTSTTYNVFSILQLPIPHARSSKIAIERCLDEFFKEEILEKDDAWDCPQCKTKRRATKRFSLARLPPVLMIHFKRFEANGRFSDKIDTFVDFPMKNLDLTNYMPPPLPPGADKSQLNGGLPMSPDDPRTQLPPYRYDLYGVTNHYGNLSSGHYTAFVASRGGWMYCDDSSVKSVDSKQVVNQKAYVLFYKRVRL